jgi:hypothetical protein
LNFGVTYLAKPRQNQRVEEAKQCEHARTPRGRPRHSPALPQARANALANAAVLRGRHSLRRSTPSVKTKNPRKSRKEHCILVSRPCNGTFGHARLVEVQLGFRPLSNLSSASPGFWPAFFGRRRDGLDSLANLPCHGLSFVSIRWVEVRQPSADQPQPLILSIKR